MASTELSGKTALVTGASSGLGVDFARELAARGCNLVLVARREDLLKQVQAELQARAVKVSIVSLDLGTAEAPRALHDLLRLQNIEVDVLVNNAGFGLFGQDLQIPWPRMQQMLQLNMLTLTELTRLFAADMVRRRRGWIMQIASTGAYQPTPTYAAYAASKAYVLSYGEALNYELRGSGVSVQRVGDTIVLNMPSDVTFSTGSADIDAKFFPVLDEVAQILNQYPATYIDVVGHADSQGSDDFNLDLSERRANSTAGYLAAHKVKSERIYIAGMGERVPVASNDTAEGRAKNRRVEITLRPMVD